MKAEAIKFNMMDANYEQRRSFIGHLCKLVEHNHARATSFKNKLINENILAPRCGNETGLNSYNTMLKYFCK